jgi:hypothetical protein
VKGFILPRDEKKVVAAGEIRETLPHMVPSFAELSYASTYSDDMI